MADLRQSSQYGRYLQVLGWQAKRIDKCQIFIKKIPFLPFSIIKIQRPEPPIPFLKIEKLAKKHRAFLIKLEPLTDPPAGELPGFRRDSWPLLPTKTIQVDLIKTEKQLLQGVNKRTRYCLRRAEKLKVQSVSWQKFYPLLRKLGKGYLPKEKEFQALITAFGKNAWLLAVNPPAGGPTGGPAGAVILIHDQTAYYFYAFTSPAARKVFSQHLLVWEAIKRAKKAGCRVFDLEGIEDNRYRFTRKWHGFSHFKKSFGGVEVEFLGSFTRWRRPI